MPNKRIAGNLATLQHANGRHTYAGTLASSSAAAVSNSSTGTAFILDPGEWLLLQPDAAGYVGVGATSAAAITACGSTKGLKLTGDEKWSCLLGPTEAFVAFVAVSGDANCKVWTQA